MVPYVEVGLHGDPHLSPDCVGLGRYASLLLLWDLEMTLTHKMAFSLFPFILLWLLWKGLRQEMRAKCQARSSLAESASDLAVTLPSCSGSPYQTLTEWLNK